MERTPVVLTFDEARLLKALADVEGIPVGAFVRRLIAQEALRRGFIPPMSEPTEQHTAVPAGREGGNNDRDRA